jgi:hypothetical protein
LLPRIMPVPNAERVADSRLSSTHRGGPLEGTAHDLEVSWGSSRVVVTMQTARAPTGSRSRIPGTPRRLRDMNSSSAEQPPASIVPCCACRRRRPFDRNNATVCPRQPSRCRWAQRRGSPQYFSIQLTTSLIVALRGIMCDDSYTTRRLCSGLVPRRSNSGSCDVTVGKK